MVDVVKLAALLEHKAAGQLMSCVGVQAPGSTSARPMPAMSTLSITSLSSKRPRAGGLRPAMLLLQDAKS